MALTLASIRDYLSSSTGRMKTMAAVRGFLATGVPFLVLNVVFDRLMQGAGDTMTPLILNGILKGVDG